MLCRYDVEHDENLKNFDSAVFSVKHAGEAVSWRRMRSSSWPPTSS